MGEILFGDLVVRYASVVGDAVLETRQALVCIERIHIVEQAGIEMRIKPSMAGVAECEEVRHLSRAPLGPGPDMVDIEYDIDVIIWPAPTDPTPPIVTVENSHPELRRWRALVRSRFEKREINKSDASRIMRGTHVRDPGKGHFRDRSFDKAMASNEEKLEQPIVARHITEGLAHRLPSPGISLIDDLGLPKFDTTAVILPTNPMRSDAVARPPIIISDKRDSEKLGCAINLGHPPAGLAALSRS